MASSGSGGTVAHWRRHGAVTYPQQQGALQRGGITSSEGMSSGVNAGHERGRERARERTGGGGRGRRDGLRAASNGARFASHRHLNTCPLYTSDPADDLTRVHPACPSTRTQERQHI